MRPRQLSATNVRKASLIYCWQPYEQSWTFKRLKLNLSWRGAVEALRVNRYWQLHRIVWGRVSSQDEDLALIRETIPAWRKWFSAMCASSPTTSTHHSRNILNSRAMKSSFSCHFFLMNFLSTPKCSSIGLKSGEYGGRNSNTTPASRHICTIFSEWCQDALSIIMTDFDSGYLL